MAADEPQAEPDPAGAEIDPAESRVRIERLFREHNNALLCFINARLHSWSESKEIAQEAYIKLLGLNDSQAISYLRACLYRIASNLVTDRIREREVRARHEHLVFFEVHDREREVRSAEAESIVQQERQRLEEALVRLPPKCRLAFSLVELEGRAVHAVAERMGIQPESVRRFVHRGYEYLAEALIDQLTESRGGRP